MQLSQSEVAALHRELMAAIRTVVADMFRAHGLGGTQFSSEWNSKWETEVNNALVAVLKPKITS
jgi:hypothetical protein